MLMEYFTYEELKDIKKQVIDQHCRQQRWVCAAEVLKGFNLLNQAEELHKAFKYSDHEKTDDGELGCVCVKELLNNLLKESYSGPYNASLKTRKRFDLKKRV